MRESYRKVFVMFSLSVVIKTPYRHRREWSDKRVLNWTELIRQRKTEREREKAPNKKPFIWRSVAFCVPDTDRLIDSANPKVCMNQQSHLLNSIFFLYYIFLFASFLVLFWLLFFLVLFSVSFVLFFKKMNLAYRLTLILITLSMCIH